METWHLQWDGVLSPLEESKLHSFVVQVRAEPNRIQLESNITPTRGNLNFWV